jgi:hypothetical protein
MNVAGVLLVLCFAGLIVVAGLVAATIVLLGNRRRGHGSGATGLPTDPGSMHGTANGAATGVSHTDGQV